MLHSRLTEKDAIFFSIVTEKIFAVELLPVPKVVMSLSLYILPLQTQKTGTNKCLGSMGLPQLRCNAIKFHYAGLICKMLLALIVLIFKPMSVGTEMNGGWCNGGTKREF